jgi:hypothetical protein
MDVIFLNSDPTTQINFNRTIGPYKIAHWLRKHGYQAQVIDFISRFSEEQLYNMITHFITPSTSIIGVSTTFLTNMRYPWPNNETRRIPYGMWMVLSRIRKEYPYIKIVAGGYMSDRIPDYGIFDDTVMTYTGSNEDAFLEYVKYVKKQGKAPLGTLTFPSMKSRENRPRMVYSSPRSTTYNIETDDFRFTKQDGILPNEPLPLDVSRGCIFACRFCQYPHLGKGKLDYIRGMEYLEEELRQNYENFGTTMYYMLDDTFNDTEWKMGEFLKMTQRLPFKIKYVSYLRADLIHRFPDTAHMLKESGLWGAYHGIESLHPYASNLVGKAWSGKSAREFIPKLFHDIWKGEIPQTLSFIVGLPKETKEDVLSTKDWFIDNNLYNAHFKGLALFGKDNEASRYSIHSEFDKNSEKYGFWFEEGAGGFEGIQGWRNETWTEKEARDFGDDMNQAVRYHARPMNWMSPSFLWMGWEKEYIMTTPWDKLFTTHRKDIANFNQSKYQEYYNLIMSM